MVDLNDGETILNASIFWKITTGVITAAGLLYVFTVPVFAEETDDPVEVLPHWQKGDKARYQIIKSRRRAQGKSVTLNSKTRTELEIEVLSTENDGFVLAWTLGQTQFDDPKQAKNPLIQQMSNLLKDQRIILELDSQAAITGVQNWKDLKKSSAKILNVITAELKAAGLDEATIEKMREQIAFMFATKQQVEQMCTREAQIFFMALGVELSPSEPLEFKDVLPNPFGGEPFPSRAQFALKTVDRESDRVIITWKQTIPPDDARRIMEKTMRKMAERLGKPAPDEELLKSFSIEDSAEFVLEASTGWINSVTHKRTTKSDGTSQEDVITIKRKKE